MRLGFRCLYELRKVAAEAYPHFRSDLEDPCVRRSHPPVASSSTAQFPMGIEWITGIYQRKRRTAVAYASGSYVTKRQKESNHGRKTTRLHALSIARRPGRPGTAVRSVPA